MSFIMEFSGVQSESEPVVIKSIKKINYGDTVEY